MDAKEALRRHEAYLNQEILDVQSQMAALAIRHTKLVTERVLAIDELSKFTTMETEV